MESFSTDVLRRVAHDVKNPLTAVRLLADLLAENATHELRGDLLELVAAIDVAVVQADSLATYARVLDGSFGGRAHVPLSVIVASTVEREAFRTVEIEGASEERVDGERTRRALSSILSTSTQLTRGRVVVSVADRSIVVRHPGVQLRAEQVEALFEVGPAQRIVRSTAFGFWLARDLLDGGVKVDATGDLVVSLSV